METAAVAVIALSVFVSVLVVCALFIPRTRQGSYAAMGVGFIVLIPSMLVPLGLTEASWFFGRPLSGPASMAFLSYGLFHLIRAFMLDIRNRPH